MASIGREGERGELKRIMFRDAAGRQQSIRLGRCSDRAAQNALAGFERVLEAARVGSTIHPDGVRWLEGINGRIHARVVALGLTQPREGASATVAQLLERFAAAAVVKASTMAAYKQTTDSLRDFLGAATPLCGLTHANADAWRKAIAESGLARATVAKRVFVARSIFKRAVRWRLMPHSPFADLRAGPQSNPERTQYVPPQVIQAVLAACPNDDWRGIVALSRYAGLRCPSEVIALRWGDVNWERGRLTVRSQKTAGHEGHAVRVVPIAPQLRPILQDLFDRAEAGADAVVPSLRSANKNLRTRFERIIARAGVLPWPRLFQNLRASCEMDWVEHYPSNVVASWLGHSPLIAAQHYLQVRDIHFDRAAGLPEAATNPATQVHPSTPTASEGFEQVSAQNSEPYTAKCFECAGLVGDVIACDQVSDHDDDCVKTPGMGGEGFEPP